jgi:hypothetical protein
MNIYKIGKKMPRMHGQNVPVAFTGMLPGQKNSLALYNNVK